MSVASADRTVPEIGDFPAMDDLYDVAPGLAEQYRRDGHIVLREVASRAEVEAYRSCFAELVERLREQRLPLSDLDTYGKAFVQLGLTWRRSQIAKRFVFAGRFAGIAARLLGVPAVRLYSDQALFKEPSGGHTPWHQDQVYWPLAGGNAITMWMPLVDISAAMGTMTFASGTHLLRQMSELTISDESEIEFERQIKEGCLPVVNSGDMAAGDATFHAGWTLHGAPSNHTDRMRAVITVIYYTDGTRLEDEIRASSSGDYKGFFPATMPGEVAAGELHPILFPFTPSPEGAPIS